MHTKVLAVNALGIRRALRHIRAGRLRGRGSSILFLGHRHTAMLQVQALPPKFRSRFEIYCTSYSKTKNTQNYPHTFHFKISSIRREQITVSSIAKCY